MSPTAGAEPNVPTEVASYKQLLREILDRRPSGTRQRLATALAKNRSFISQISNPAYGTPVPARHLDTIFELCHFTGEEKRRFLDLYHAAHPRRLAEGKRPRRLRTLTLHIPELESEERNRELERLLNDFVQRLSRLFDET